MLTTVASADWGILRSKAALPVLALVVAGAFWRLRSLWYYVSGGCIGLGCAPLIIEPGNQPASAGLSASAMPFLMFGFAGLVGGFVYWLIAGCWQARGLFR